MKTRLTAAILASILSNMVIADEYEDYASVESVVPRYERVNVPSQACETMESDASQQDYADAIIGGIAGAIIGNQVGGGNGRVAATALGAITGAIVGGRMQAPSEVRRCRALHHWENRFTGYRVNYVYAGRSHETIMPNDPGREMRVRVSVSPE